MSQHPEDVAASRHKEIAKARDQIAKVEAALVESREHHAELEGRLVTAQIRDRERLGAALVAGKPEPESEADQLREQIARQEQRTEALMAAADAARREIPKLVEKHREAWLRQGRGDVAKARKRYLSAIVELEAARDAIDAEATLVGWLQDGLMSSAANDALGGRASVELFGQAISFPRTLEALRGDCEHLASYPIPQDGPTPEPAMHLIWTGTGRV